MMELIPAIDILGGAVVRLAQGRYDAVTHYADDPLQIARKFEAAGATRLHVVDLDGAKAGRAINQQKIEQVVSQTGLQVQVGGGIRDTQSAKAWLDLGVARVVLGTIAIKEPNVAQAICQRSPDRVVIAIDARAGKVATEGWTEASETEVIELARRVDAWRIAAILYTNIERDGMRSGPDVQGTASLQDEINATVIASGGIGSLEHLKELKAAGVRAAVCGRALYSGAFTLQEAFAALGEDEC